uniref:PAP-associated domain-containing protein n=1 Tax=Anopheles dirus TaxID=7168 RepID=A0A182NL83_9DIPT
MGRTKVRKTSFSHCPNITSTLNSNGSVKIKTLKPKPAETIQATPEQKSTGSSYENYTKHSTCNHTICAYQSDPHPLRSHLLFFNRQTFRCDGRVINSDKYQYTIEFLNNVRQRMYSEPDRRTLTYSSSRNASRSIQTDHSLANLLRHYGYNNNYLESNLCYYAYHKEYIQRRRNWYGLEQDGSAKYERENERYFYMVAQHPKHKTHPQPMKSGSIKNHVPQDNSKTSDDPRSAVENGDTSQTESPARECSSESSSPSPTSMAVSPSESLSQDIWQMFFETKQSDETFGKKIKLWQTLYGCFQQMSPWMPKYELYLMGSTISGFGTDGSDMDMCIVDINGPMYCDTRTEALNNLLRVKSFIESMRSMCFERVDLIRAKVPILRFHHAQERIDIDLSINNRVGIRNTHLLNCYAQLDVRVRPLVVIIKLWAQHHSLNDPKNSTMSSYSLVLMVISFLQCGVHPAVLPCLHSMHPEKFCIDSFPNNLLERINSYTSENKDTLGKLLVMFYKHYAEFDYTNYAISVRTGSLLPVEKCKWNDNNLGGSRSGNYLCIEEPFNRTNTGKSVYNKQIFEQIKSAFVASWKMLEENQELSILFGEPLFTPSLMSSASSYF